LRSPFSLMRKRNSHQMESKLKRILQKPHQCIEDTLLLFLILFIVFFINVLLIIKTQLINIFQNILRRIWYKVINYPKPYCDSNKNKIRQCAICLNNLNLEVSLSCFHSFCGKNLFDIFRFI